ncbi:hypothetical protein [Granulicella tundricola]|uniref:Putative transcriptional regulator n=1 Tax=Granulicella tundricola (strain ATCC BAA-1859 / DSM 23138 / MP5ACTX9) TaxID=1198114 RepID=E8WZG3_GRATM|nr:hypothetical protein [Granulicella tundricola]ADW68851.1 putative transcriptional regulator [Granulicella tundricola MP5ACTX9]
MSIDTLTVKLLSSVLKSETRKKLFTMVAGRRIADMDQLKEATSGSDIRSDLEALENADLIGAGQASEKYYVTARGLKVARDLQELSIG